MSINCSTSVPRSQEFLEGLSVTDRYLILVCGVLCLIAVTILIDNIVFIWRKHSRLRAAVITSTWLVAMCPLLAVLALMTMLVPNAFLFRDVTVSVSQSVIMYKFVQLLSTYADSFTSIRERILAEKIHFNVRPICCCFTCIPTARPSRALIRLLKVLVLQNAVIMVILTNIIMISWLDGKYIPGVWDPSNLYPYLSAARVLSVLVAIYALNILVALCMKAMSSLYVKHKFNALSLCLVFFSIQGFTFDIMAANDVFDVGNCFSSRVMGKFYENMVFCMEMFLLTIFNLWSYRRPLGPPVDMTDLEKPSLHQAIADSILSSSLVDIQHSFSSRFHQLTIPHLTNLRESNVDVNLRQGSTIRISSSSSVVQKYDTLVTNGVLPFYNKVMEHGID